MPPVLAAIGLAIGSAGVFISGVAAVASAIPVIGGVLAAGLEFGAEALIGAGAAIAAGGLGGFLALAKFAGNVALIASLVGGTPKITNPGSVLQFKADPTAGIPYLVGRCATGGNIVARLSSNDPKHTYLHNVVVLSGCGPHEAIESFKLGDPTITFSSGAATGTFAGVLWMNDTLGPVSSWSLSQPGSTGSVPEWTSAHKLTGYAAAWLTMKSSQAKFPGGNFDPPLWIGKWAKLYDPRLDSTQTAIGGSGSQRLNDESTWTWSDNPYLAALTWCIGRRQNGVLVMGIGAPASLIDVAAFAEGANIAYENGWKLGGGVTSNDDRYQVLISYLQAGGGVPIRKGGKISCLVSMPRTSVATIEEADLVGPVTRSRQQPRSDRFNQITPSYVSEAHNWQTVAATAYKVSAYATAEGLRNRDITYPLVQNATQATQLGAYGIYDTHEIGPIKVSVRPRFAGIGIGDVFTGYFPKIGVEADLLVLDKTFNPVTLAIDLSCRTENSGKHTDALGLTGTAPSVPSPTRPDPKVVDAPLDGQWTLESTTETVGGYTNPRIRFVGSTSDNANVSDVVFRYSLDGSTLIDIAKAAPTAAGDIRIPNPVSGQTYYGHVSYIVRGVEGPALLIGPVTAGVLVIPGAGGGGGGAGPGETDIGGTIIESSTPGSYATDAVNFTGTVLVETTGGGGSPTDPYLDPKTGAVVNPSGDGGDGGYSSKVISVTIGDVLTGTIGAGGLVDTTGGDTTCDQSGQTAHGGTPGSADSMGSYNGSGGTATGGTTNTTGGVGSGPGVPGGGGVGVYASLGANGKIKITRAS